MNNSPSYPTPHIDVYAQKRGVCVLGETGTGVSHMLQTRILDEVRDGRRILCIDPYGDIARSVGTKAPNAIVWRVGAEDAHIYLDLFHTQTYQDPFQIAEHIIDMMYALFDPLHTGVIGPRFEHALRNAVVALLDAKQASFFNVVKLLTDQSYLQSILPLIGHESVRRYFTDQMANTSDFHKSEVLDYIISKLSIFVEPESFIGKITSPENKTSLHALLTQDNHSILLDMSLLLKQPKHVRTLIYNILASQCITALNQDANTLQKSSLFIDEANRFDYSNIDDILTLCRKLDMHVTYTVRELALMKPEAQYVYLAGRSIISYRISPPDALVLQPYFDGFIDHEAISVLPNYHFVARIRTKEGVSFHK